MQLIRKVSSFWVGRDPDGRKDGRKDEEQDGNKDDKQIPF
jgi:hypothetical protein